MLSSSAFLKITTYCCLGLHYDDIFQLCPLLAVPYHAYAISVSTNTLHCSSVLLQQMFGVISCIQSYSKWDWKLLGQGSNVVLCHLQELQIVLSYEHKAFLVLTREKMRLIPITFFCHLPVCSHLMPSHFILSLFEFLACFSPLSFHGPAWYLVRIRTLLNLFHETEIFIHCSPYSFIPHDQWCFSWS